jgi:hypothetical protein
MTKQSCLRIGVLQAFILVFTQFSIAATVDNWQFYSTVMSGGGSYSPNTFVTVTHNGEMTQRGAQGATPYEYVMDMDPVSGFLFGANAYDKPGVITKIDPATGQWSDVANIRQGASPVYLMALSFSPNGTLYGVNTNKTLGIVNLGASTFSPVATLDIEQTWGMDFSPQGVLYLADSSGSGDTFQQWLRTIDVSTGEITSTIPTGTYNVGDMDFAPDGYIYHTNFSWQLFRMDPATGEQTNIGSGELGPFGGIASDNVPEPATLLLLGLGWPIVSRLRKKQATVSNPAKPLI